MDKAVEKMKFSMMTSVFFPFSGGLPLNSQKLKRMFSAPAVGTLAPVFSHSWTKDSAGGSLLALMENALSSADALAVNAPLFDRYDYPASAAPGAGMDYHLTRLLIQDI